MCIVCLEGAVLLTQYCAGGKIVKNEMGWACGSYGGGEGAYRVLVGKPEGKKPLGRPRRRWVDNILAQYCAGDKIVKNEMGWACGSYGGGEGGV